MGHEDRQGEQHDQGEREEVADLQRPQGGRTEGRSQRPERSRFGNEDRRFETDDQKIGDVQSEGGGAHRVSQGRWRQRRRVAAGG